MEFNNLLFPERKSSYTSESLFGDLVYIPKAMYKVRDSYDSQKMQEDAKEKDDKKVD